MRMKVRCTLYITKTNKKSQLKNLDIGEDQPEFTPNHKSTKFTEYAKN